MNEAPPPAEAVTEIGMDYEPPSRISARLRTAAFIVCAVAFVMAVLMLGGTLD